MDGDSVHLHRTVYGTVTPLESLALKTWSVNWELTHILFLETLMGGGVHSYNVALRVCVCGGDTTEVYGEMW